MLRLLLAKAASGWEACSLGNTPVGASVTALTFAERLRKSSEFRVARRMQACCKSACWTAFEDDAQVIQRLLGHLSNRHLQSLADSRAEPAAGSFAPVFQRLFYPNVYLTSKIVLSKVLDIYPPVKPPVRSSFLTFSSIILNLHFAHCYSTPSLHLPSHPPF